VSTLSAVDARPIAAFLVEHPMRNLIAMRPSVRAFQVIAAVGAQERTRVMILAVFAEEAPAGMILPVSPHERAGGMVTAILAAKRI
jgi:hypothetical protein